MARMTKLLLHTNRKL